MKKSSILHPGLFRLVAKMGHRDTLVIGEAGLPIPACVQRSPPAPTSSCVQASRFNFKMAMISD